jgi:hypothetical protein
VFGGSYSGRGCMRGDTGGPAPIKALRRAIARQRIEVVVDEFRSTITHSNCGTDLIPRPHDPTGREKYCPHCQVNVPRDIDAGRSIDSIWDSKDLADSLDPRRPSRVVVTHARVPPPPLCFCFVSVRNLVTRYHPSPPPPHQWAPTQQNLRQ